MRSDTPILDFQTPLPKSRNEVSVKGLLKAVPVAIGVLIVSFAVIFLIIELFVRPPEWAAETFSVFSGPIEKLFSNGPFLPILMIWVAMFLCLLTHEAGHAIAAVLNKWPIVQFRVLPFYFQREGGKLALRVSWKLWPAGLVIANPITPARFHSKVRIFALGGPSINLAVGILAAFTLRKAEPSMYSGFWSIFAIWSLVSGFLNLMPFQIRQLELDGYTAFVISRKPPQLSMRLAAHKLLTHVINGEPIETMNPRWVALAESSERSSLQNRLGIWLAYSYWLKKHQFAKAAPLLERLLRGSGDADQNYKGVLFAECAVFSALTRQPLAAKTWREHAFEFSLPDFLRHRCNSYVAWATQDFAKAYDEALSARDAFVRRREKNPDLFLLEWSRWIEVLEKARSEQTSRDVGRVEAEFHYT